MSVIFGDRHRQDGDPRRLHMKHMDAVQREAVEDLANIEVRRLTAAGFHYSYLQLVALKLREVADEQIQKLGGAAKA